jgi:hypothetical protein
MVTPEIKIALIGLLGAIVGGGITAFTTWLIARTERTKFARERLWDLRREAYTKIIASIVPAARLAKHMHHRYQEDAHGYDASKEVRQATSEYVAHFRAAQDAFHINRLMLSPTFAGAFERMLHKLGEVGSNQNLIPPEAAEIAWQVIEAESRALIKLALDEIDAGVDLGPTR